MKTSSYNKNLVKPVYDILDDAKFTGSRHRLSNYYYRQNFDLDATRWISKATNVVNLANH